MRNRKGNKGCSYVNRRRRVAANKGWVTRTRKQGMKQLAKATIGIIYPPTDGGRAFKDISIRNN